MGIVKLVLPLLFVTLLTYKLYTDTTYRRIGKPVNHSRSALIRASLFLFASLFVCWVVYREVRIVWIVAVTVFLLALFWIAFDLFFNALTGRPWDYASVNPKGSKIDWFFSRHFKEKAGVVMLCIKVSILIICITILLLIK